MASELREHRATQLGKKARGKEAEEQRQKEAYLEFEVSPPPWVLWVPSLDPPGSSFYKGHETRLGTLGRPLDLSEPVSIFVGQSKGTMPGEGRGGSLSN